MNQYSQNYENAKKCVLALKNSFQPIQFGSNNKLISQESCLKLLKALALKELQDISQQEKEDRLRYNEQNLQLLKRKSSQMRSDIKDDEIEEDLEIVKIKKIKRNEINNENLQLKQCFEEKKEEEDNSNENEDGSNYQFLAQHNNIQIQYFEECFNSQLISMIYANFNRPSSDIAKLFQSLNSVSEMFRHLKTIYKNQSIVVSQQTKMQKVQMHSYMIYLSYLIHTQSQQEHQKVLIFEECFGYVAEKIIIAKEEFLNDIIKDYTILRSFIEETKIRTEQLYILLSRVIQHEYRQDVQKFQDTEFSPLLKLFTDICSKLPKDELKIAFRHYIKINHRTSLLEKGVKEFERIIQGENLLKEAFKEKLYLLKNQSLDSNESDHISSFLVYMVFRIKSLFEDLFESFQQYSQSVQQQIMNRLTRDQNKKKIKTFLAEKPNPQKGQQPFLPILISVFEYNNSYMLQVFIYDLLTKSESQFIDQTESKRILELLKSHVNQTQNIFDFYKSFPEYYDEQIIVDYKNIKDLQAANCAQFKEKFSFLPEAKVQSTHLLLLKRFLQEDSWFITKENMGEFINYLTDKTDRDDLIDYLLKHVTEEKQNLNALIVPFILKVASQAIRDQNEKHEKQIQSIILEMAINRVWTIHNNFQIGLKIYFKDLCSQEVKTSLYQKITQHFATQLQGKEFIAQFEEMFDFA